MPEPSEVPTVATGGPFGAVATIRHGNGYSRPVVDRCSTPRALNDLVEQSIKANPNMTAAQAALRQARENTAAQKGLFSAGFRRLYASRNLTPIEALSPAGPTPNPYYSLITPR